MVKKLLFHLKIDYLLQINSNNTMPGKLVSRMSKRECYTLTEIDTVRVASQNLHEKKVGSMPVLDKNKNVVGINIKPEFPKSPDIIINNKFDKSIDQLKLELLDKISIIVNKKNYK